MLTAGNLPLRVPHQWGKRGAPHGGTAPALQPEDLFTTEKNKMGQQGASVESLAHGVADAKGGSFMATAAHHVSRPRACQ